MAAILLALGTSGCYGVANLLAPLFTRRFPLAAVLIAGQGAAMVAALVGLAVAGEPVPGGRALAVAALAGAGNAVGLIGFLRATELGPVSIAAPIGATGGALPVFYDLAKGGSLSGAEAAGVVLALLGVVLASRRPPVDRPLAEDAPHDLRGCVTAALVSAAGFGTLLIALPQASVHGRWWALVDARAVIVVGVVAFALSTRRPMRPEIPALPRLAIPGLLLLSGTLLYTLATDRGSLSVVSVLASLNPAVTVALAYVLLGERLSRPQAYGIGAIVAGVCIVAAG